MFGYQSDARTLQQVPAVGRLMPVLLQTLQAFVAARPPLAPAGSQGAAGAAGSAPGGRSQLGAMVDRGTLKLLKSLRQVQEMHPWYAGGVEWCSWMGRVHVCMGAPAAALTCGYVCIPSLLCSWP